MELLPKKEISRRSLFERLAAFKVSISSTYLSQVSVSGHFDKPVPVFVSSSLKFPQKI